MAKLIHNWKELSEVPATEEHKIVIVPEDGNGWIVEIATDTEVEYLSTHTFYGSSFQASTTLLQMYDFDVEIVNQDKDTNCEVRP